MTHITGNSTLKEIQKHLDETCKENGWDKNSITEVFLLFSEESGELAKAIRKVTGFKGENVPGNALQNLNEELADVFNYLLEIANRFDVDLAESYIEKFKKNQTRKWE